MSERLQELPPPMGRQVSPKQDAEGFSFPQDMDTDAAEPSQVILPFVAENLLQTGKACHLQCVADL